MARGILTPWSGIEPVSPALEGGILNHWTSGEIPLLLPFFWDAKFMWNNFLWKKPKNQQRNPSRLVNKKSYNEAGEKGRDTVSP